MDWRRKAQIQRVCAALPRGDLLYQRLQRNFGTLTPDPFERVLHHSRMVNALRKVGFDVEAARCLEVGTGHIPVLPVLFHLAGAREIVTVDLHRRLQWDLTGESMAMLVAGTDDLVTRYSGLIDETGLRQRLSAMGEFTDRPREFFDHAGIRYVAPGDAASMPDEAASFDLHFSTTVLEHIEPDILAGILAEARRLLRPNGVACHIIDPGDHFAHADNSITLINFLQFSDKEWDKIAGNEFGYCNRLRYPELLDIFSTSGLAVLGTEVVVDERSKQKLKSGFTLDPLFARFSHEELCSVTIDVVALRAD